MKELRRGFTLIELMIVVAIIWILAAIAIPKFADLINKSKEGATKGSLASVRSAIQVYYGDNEGWFPADTLGCLNLNGKYLSEIPLAKLPGTGHADSRAVSPNSLTEQGGWAYGNAGGINRGVFVVNCSHEDLKGTADAAVSTPWTSF